jgi:hypothetical protein
MPTPAADSYGSPEGVAALASTWTREGEWLDEDAYTQPTNPTLTTVVEWIDQISALLNIALSNYGFVVPLATTRGVLAASSVIEGYVSDLARYANQKGRFASNKFEASGMSIWETIRDDLNAWVSLYAPGLEGDGEQRQASNVYKIGSKAFDATGEKVFPIFQRKAFGNRFDNWSKQ